VYCSIDGTELLIVGGTFAGSVTDKFLLRCPVCHSVTEEYCKDPMVNLPCNSCDEPEWCTHCEMYPLKIKALYRQD
jgi:hypothetical protein